ncbi:hypothetical protein B4102_3328 [Heyndrickxia sporothermodurans]|uniref:Uncharacterized protein n=1 Tax=Heyndrickxia sporothermodurans TaxID=46224 RepID=A0A150KVN8_9BACI|nr:hypothetical protein [Heyndrickxia sporothermodurans]KYD04108.1 hypothetical protein B4102_3328 [Heyndrickxia sporothermodurans]
METRGRKATIYDEQEIKNIVFRYIQEEKIEGLITYSEMYRFAKKLYENGEIPYKLSDEFWRRSNRQGRKIVDETNESYKVTVQGTKTDHSDVFIDTEECVNKFFSGKTADKKRLIQALKLNEKKAKESSKYIEKIEQQSMEIEVQKNKVKELQKLVEQQQTILFSWFNASHKSDVPLINLMTTGKSRHPIVDLFFETAFSNKEEGYKRFEDYSKSIVHTNPSSSQKEQGNVVTPLRKSRIKQLSEQLNAKDDLHK